MIKKSQKKVFVYRGPHHVHAEFARSINAEFYSNFLTYNHRVIPKIFIPLTFFVRLVSLPKADIYLTEDGYSLVLVYFGTIFNNKSKIIHFAASPLFFRLENMPFLAKFTFKKVFTKVSAIIAVSEYVKNLAKNYINLPIKVVSPFIEPDKSSPSTNLSKSNILYLGKISHQKGIDLIVDSFNDVKTKHPDAKLFFCGPLIDEDLSYKIKGFTWSGGWTNDINKYFSQCSILIHVPVFDAYAVSVLQAMSAGLIPIVSDTAGSSFIVCQINPHLVIKRDKYSLIRALEYVLNLSHKEKQILSNRAINLSKKFSKEKQIRKFKNAFNEILKEI